MSSTETREVWHKLFIVHCLWSGEYDDWLMAHSSPVTKHIVSSNCARPFPLASQLHHPSSLLHSVPCKAHFYGLPHPATPCPLACNYIWLMGSPGRRMECGRRGRLRHLWPTSWPLLPFTRWNSLSEVAVFRWQPWQPQLSSWPSLTAFLEPGPGPEDSRHSESFTGGKCPDPFHINQIVVITIQLFKYYLFGLE